MKLSLFYLPFIAASLAFATGQATLVSLHWPGLLVSCSGIYGAYFLDELFDHHSLEQIRLRDLLPLTLSALLICIALFIDPTLYLLTALLTFLGLFYIFLKRIIPKNILTALAWTIAILFISLDYSSAQKSLLMVAGMLFFLILSNALLSDFPDQEEDRTAEVCAVMVYYGKGVTRSLAIVSSLLALLLALLLSSWALATPAFCFLAIALVASQSFYSSPFFRPLVDLLLLLPGPLSFLLANG